MIVLSLSLVLLCALAFCVEWAAQCGVERTINELLAQNVIQFTGQLPPPPIRRSCARWRRRPESRRSSRQKRKKGKKIRQQEQKKPPLAPNGAKGGSCIQLCYWLAGAF